MIEHVYITSAELIIMSLIAGVLVCSSSFPALYDALRTAKFDNWFQVLRSALGAAGNGVWTAYGLLTGQLAIIIFCGTTFVLLSLLVALQTVRLSQLNQPKG